MTDVEPFWKNHVDFLLKSYTFFSEYDKIIMFDSFYFAPEGSRYDRKKIYDERTAGLGEAI